MSHKKEKPMVFIQRGLLILALLIPSLVAAQDLVSFGSTEAADTPTTKSETFLERALSPEMAEEGTALGHVLQLLNVELMTIQGDVIRVKNIILAVLVLLLGLWLARLASRLLKKRIHERKKLSRNAAYLIEKLIHYILAIIVVFFALDLAGIPLTIFTLFGGALAIAIGFGAQEILANFLSGIIIMTERPIRLGDLVEYDGHQGKVEEIGFRCTYLRMPGNVHLLVPNRKIVESKIINWTLSDPKIRTEVNVGIAYGSPTRKAEEVIHRAVTEHPDVESQPSPVVLFEEFGDNSLNFTVYFWVRVRDFMDQRKIKSAVRFRIDDLFREAGITIAFPQRDIHLDTLSPLRIEIVKDQPVPPAEAAKSVLPSTNEVQEKLQSVKTETSEFAEVDREIEEKLREEADTEEP